MAKIIRNSTLSPAQLSRLSADEVEWVYNALDVCVTAEVRDSLTDSFDETSRKTYEFSKALMGPIFEMNLRGILIDRDQKNKFLYDTNDGIKALIVRLESMWDRYVVEGVGHPPINWNSPAQLNNFFYKVLGVKAILKRNANGRYMPTTDRDAMEKLQSYYVAEPFARLVLKLRDLKKKQQFVESELDEDGRARTSYNIAGTNTGRLSSAASDYGSGRNQQNIERSLRKMFVSDRGKVLVNIDLEQADSRHVGASCWNLYYRSHGPEYAGAYLDACESGDLHTTVCKMAWHDLDWGTDPAGWRKVADQDGYRTYSYRDLAKRLGHGTNYYGTPRTMAKHSKMPISVIDDFQRAYFKAFPAIGLHDKKKSRETTDHWHGWVAYQLEQFGQITTLHYGRRRWFFGRPDDDKTLREAIAYGPQSMTADAVDTGLINLWRWGKETGLVECLAQVHDSVLFQCPVEALDEVVPKAIAFLEVKYELEGGREFYVPAEAKVGFNWADYNPKKPMDNPAGLRKWKPGMDIGERPRYRTSLRQPQSLLEALDEEAF